MIPIGLVQAAAVPEVEENLETLRRFAAEAAAAGCRAVCFPECFLTGYCPEEAESRSVTADSAAVRQAAAAAREYGLDILVGFMERAGEACHITQGIFRPDGSCDYYRKTHLGKKESIFFGSGDRLPVFPLSCGLQAGIQLCVENHYPEITQTLALKGAEVIFAPHASPKVSGDRETIWNKYIPARSYDNRVYMLCCNLWDEARFGGGCLVTGPDGNIAASSFAEGEGLLVARIDRQLLARYRGGSGKPSGHFFPQRRRPELYKVD